MLPFSLKVGGILVNLANASVVITAACYFGKVKERVRLPPEAPIYGKNVGITNSSWNFIWL